MTTIAMPVQIQTTSTKPYGLQKEEFVNKQCDLDYNYSSPTKYYGTVELSVVDSRPVAESEVFGLELLFGSWIESGDEDAQLDELYRSRALPSINSSHE